MAGTRVLLVDDVTTVRLAIRMMLKSLGCEVVSANCGRDALRVLREEPFDLVLCDIMMPEIDGLELCRKIKSEPAFKDLPVVIISSQGQKERREEAKLAGCSDFLLKPVAKADMIVAVRRWARG